MKANVGTVDRIARIILGLAVIAFGLYDESSWRWIGLAGPVLMVTALFRFCPAYWLLRIKTVMRPAGGMMP